MLNEQKAFFLCVQSGVIPYGIGQPGIGKTRTTEAFAKRFQIEYQCLIGSQRLPEDVLGAPKVLELPDRHGNQQHVMEHVKPSWRHKLENAPRGGLLHIDELGDCQPAMQAALLQILGDGIPNTWICATGNPIDISTNGYELALPAINRLCLIEWPEDRATWRRGMIQGWDAVAADFPILPAGWQSELTPVRSLVVSFCERNSSHFQALPKEQDLKAWPSQRSWTNCATVLAAAKAANAGEDVEDILIRGCVGDGAAIAFRNWIKTLDLPDPEALLANPALFKPSVRGDLSFTILCSVVAAVLRNNTPERWEAGWEIINRQADKAADIAAAVCGPLAKNRPSVNGTALEIPESVQEKLFPILQTAS